VIRRRVLLSVLAALALLLLTVPASAIQLVEVSDVSCTGLTVTGLDLPPNTALTLSVANAHSGTALKRVAVRTSATGAFTAKVKVPLRSVAAVEADVLSSSRSLISATQEFDAALKKQCGADSSLPFTGSGRTELLVAVGTVLLALGILLRVGFGYRGRHQAL
jgi:hypothetical protein